MGYLMLTDFVIAQFIIIYLYAYLYQINVVFLSIF